MQTMWCSPLPTHRPALYLWRAWPGSQHRQHQPGRHRNSDELKEIDVHHVRKIGKVGERGPVTARQQAFLSSKNVEERQTMDTLRQDEDIAMRVRRCLAELNLPGASSEDRTRPSIDQR